MLAYGRIPGNTYLAIDLIPSSHAS